MLHVYINDEENTTPHALEAWGMVAIAAGLLARGQAEMIPQFGEFVDSNPNLSKKEKGMVFYRVALLARAFRGQLKLNPEVPMFCRN